MVKTIAQRRLELEFDPAQIPERWFKNDLFLSLFTDALSLLLPEGERFFIEAVHDLREQASDPELEQRIAGFVAQEGTHAKAHRDFNAMLKDHGLTGVPRREAEVRAILWLARRLFDARGRLAATCALEHFTSLLATMVLSEDDPRPRQWMHESIRPLWVWHSLEELEHKSVAYDLFEAAGGTYQERVSIMLLTSVVFIAELSWVHLNFIAEKGILFDRRAWIAGLDHMWKEPGYFRRMIPAYFTYYRPGFHPEHQDSEGLVERWRERLFGLGGELKERLRGAA
jgi:predicted metal-dependent hydrolase